MHTYTLVILLFFLVSSFLELPNLISVEARTKLVSSNGGVFKADLIHRDSPLSPYYNPSLTLKERLKRSPLGSISRGHKIHLSSSYYGPINDTKLYDELIPNDGEYLMKFTLGTPKVEFIAIADTGSDLIWVQCSPCTYCLHQNSSLFDPTKSSTYHTIPCSSSACYHRDLQSGCLSNKTKNNTSKSSPCLYRVSYGDETRSIGHLATETITLPSSDDTAISTISFPSLRFGCGFHQNGSLNGGDGIIGIGTGPSSLISQLGPSINHKFSYCLTPLSSNVSSKLAFGADVTGTGVVSTPFTTGATSAHYYNISLNGISIGSKDTPVQVPLDLQVVIDSGTTLTYLVGSVYSSLRAALASAIEASTVPSPQEPYDLCYNSGAQFNPPDVVFHFERADVVLKAINTFREIGDGVTCLAMAATNGTAVLGNIAQVNFHIGYDLTAKLVSFVPTDCTKF